MVHTALYFGSFNPVHRGHIALAEYVIEKGYAEEVVLIVSPQNPHKQSADLAAEFSRYQMCQMACESSAYPEKIKVSAVEFTLPRPSYTINTLRFLSENFGDVMNFSILMGADNIANFDRWKDWQQIIEKYPILVYPRRGYEIDKFADRVTYMADAPHFDYAATDIRNAIARKESIDDMVCPQVAAFIRQNNLWSPAMYITALSSKLEQSGDDIEALLERGTWYFRTKEYRLAAADFRAVIALDGENDEAKRILELIEELTDE